jgi:hypothetical protein
VVVAPNIVATADHVIRVENTYYLPKISFSNSAEAQVTEIIRKWPERDLVILRVSVPDVIPPVEISGDTPDTAVALDFDGNERTFRYCITNNESNYFDYTPRTGESGGPVFSNGRLVGIVSGGNFWLKDKPNHTWPLRAGRVDVIKDYIVKEYTK